MSEMKYVASVSFGKDSLAMLLLILEKGLPLHEVVFYDTGMEFQAIYSIRDRILPILEEHGVKYTELHPPRPFLFDMLEKPVNSKKNGFHYGYSWCGGCARWGTATKTAALDSHARKAGKNVVQYVGIAADEPKRLRRLEENKVAPLADWGITEADAPRLCYEGGYFWEENGFRLYDILDRVSCWCCANKNLKELRNIYTHLPEYWNRLKEIQARTDRPMKGEGKSVRPGRTLQKGKTDMICRKKERPKWRYDFNCRKCDNIQEIHDNRKNRHGDYCVACIERADAGLPSPIHADEADRVVRCDCFKAIPEKEGEPK